MKTNIYIYIYKNLRLNRSNPKKVVLLNRSSIVLETRGAQNSFFHYQRGISCSLHAFLKKMHVYALKSLYTRLQGIIWTRHGMIFNERETLAALCFYICAIAGLKFGKRRGYRYTSFYKNHFPECAGFRMLPSVTVSFFGILRALEREKMNTK